MKKFEIENVLNQKRLVTHIAIFLFSLIVMFINSYIVSGVKSWDYYLGGLILIFSQVEVFIFISHLIFKDMNPGTTPGEITRIVLSRFALFLIACLIAAFIIFISFIYIRQLLSGGDLSKVISDFFKYSFTTWFNSTIGGLSFGAVIFIIILWQDALRREQKLREENLIFQNETLKNQVNPHFLFNSLNTLTSLVHKDADKAVQFIIQLSDIYRYALENKNKRTVPWPTEKKFVENYLSMQQIRFSSNISVSIETSLDEKFEVIPLSVQMLVENAIKHNIITADDPLEIAIYVENNFLVVRNKLQLKSSVEYSENIGLANIKQQYEILAGQKAEVSREDGFFTVKLPLIAIK